MQNMKVASQGMLRQQGKIFITARSHFYRAGHIQEIMPHPYIQPQHHGLFLFFLFTGIQALAQTRLRYAEHPCRESLITIGPAQRCFGQNLFNFCVGR
jgi:hypothetical protein